MIEINEDFLSLEFKEKDVLIPVDSTDESKGTVSVRLREIPYAVKKSLDLRFYSASAQLETAYTVLSKISKGASDPLVHEDLDKVGAAFGSLRAAQLEIIRWAVCGHKADDFLVKGQPQEFTSEDTIVAGVRYQVASRKMLRLYTACSGDGLDTANTSLLANLANASRLFQMGQTQEPKEIWAAYAKP